MPYGSENIRNVLERRGTSRIFCGKPDSPNRDGKPMGTSLQCFKRGISLGAKAGYTTSQQKSRRSFARGANFAQQAAARQYTVISTNLTVDTLRGIANRIGVSFSRQAGGDSKAQLVQKIKASLAIRGVPKSGNASYPYKRP